MIYLYKITGIEDTLTGATGNCFIISRCRLQHKKNLFLLYVAREMDNILVELQRLIIEDSALKHYIIG